MVLEVGAETRLAAVVGAQEPAVGVAHLAEQELRAGDGGIAVVGTLERRARVGQGGDHQRVPGGQPLVVERRPHALLARFPQPRLDLIQPLGIRRRAHRCPAALEVGRPGHAEVRERNLGEVVVAERGPHLLGRPDVEAALLALGVGVERRREAALLLAQVAQRPVERLGADAGEERLAGDLEAVQVRARQQRVVVEHLLEVRDHPARVDRVPREPAADLVVHGTGGHRPQRVQRHLALAATEQELDHRRGRELRRARGEPAVPGVVAALQRRHRGIQAGGVHLALGRRHARGARQPRQDAPAGLLDRRHAARSTRCRRRSPPATRRASRAWARAASRCRRRTAWRRA